MTRVAPPVGRTELGAGQRRTERVVRLQIIGVRPVQVPRRGALQAIDGGRLSVNPRQAAVRREWQEVP